MTVCASSFEIRKDSFGRFAYDKNGGGENTNWINLSHYSLMFVKNWESRGAINTDFKLVNRPLSYEFGAHSYEIGYTPSTYALLFPNYLLARLCRYNSSFFTPICRGKKGDYV